MQGSRRSTAREKEQAPGAREPAQTDCPKKGLLTSQFAQALSHSQNKHKTLTRRGHTRRSHAVGQGSPAASFEVGTRWFTPFPGNPPGRNVCVRAPNRVRLAPGQQACAVHWMVLGLQKRDWEWRPSADVAAMVVAPLARALAGRALRLGRGGTMRAVGRPSKVKVN